MPKLKPVTAGDTVAKEKFVRKLIDWLAERDLWFETSIYACGKRYSDDVYGADKDIAEKQVTEKSNAYYVTDCPDPRAIVEYANPDLITMTFEGPLYHALNYEFSLEEKLQAFFAKYGMYFEYGYAWSLSSYPA